MTIVSIAIIALILAVAFGGMRLIQRISGCACAIDLDREEA